MASYKLRSMIKVSLGAATCFLGYNLYLGDYRLYARHVMPFIHYAFPDAERAHLIAIKAARYGLVPNIPEDDEIKPLLTTKLWGIEFDNPIGLAAGFDKDGEAITGTCKFGFGFLELGTTTPLPQKGNPFPRIFRLTPDRAIINRCGFNNLGHQEMEANLTRQQPIIEKQRLRIGLNLGVNRDTTDKTEDYLKGLRRFHSMDSIQYFVINVSSPNTPNLRALQRPDQLERLLDRILREKRTLETAGRRKPLLVKLAPDLSDEQATQMARVLLKYRHGNETHSSIDGIIISNTTIARPNSMRSPDRLQNETGGLSGPPLKDMSTQLIGHMYRLTGGAIPIIGVGGIETGLDAFEKIKAGASLVQLYTSLTYFGPPVVREIKYELAYLLAQNGFDNVSQAVGAGNSIK